MNIIQSITDKHLFRLFLADKNNKLSSWLNWSIVLRMLYGLPVKEKHRSLVKELSGRDLDKLPKQGFSTGLFLVGRRGGKSSISALVASYEATLSGKEKGLSPGEQAMVSIVSPTRLQSRIIKSYIRAALSSPLFEAEIIQEDKDGFLLSNNIRIQILVGDFRTTRGFTQILVIADEVCFLGMTEESKIKNDAELIQSVRPALLTTGGKLLAISTKYAKRGWAYKTWKKNFGNDTGKVLVVDAPSILMNPTLNQSEIDEIVAEDPIANRAEFLNLWREGISAYITREIVEACVVKNRIELLPRFDIKYTAFCDLSGGRNESASLAISHKTKDKAVLDFVREYRAPFSPNFVIEKMVDELSRYRVTRIFGDRYAGEFVSAAFQRLGIRYVSADRSKSMIYLEFIPVVSSRAVELLDSERMIAQFANLQRKTRSGGADQVDHLQGFSDDVCNSVAGAVVYTTKKGKQAGSLFRHHDATNDELKLREIKRSRQILGRMAAIQY